MSSMGTDKIDKMNLNLWSNTLLEIEMVIKVHAVAFEKSNFPL